jgi:hypothetical protein
MAINKAAMLNEIRVQYDIADDGATIVESLSRYAP